VCGWGSTWQVSHLSSPGVPGEHRCMGSKQKVKWLQNGEKERERLLVSLEVFLMGDTRLRVGDRILQRERFSINNTWRGLGNTGLATLPFALHIPASTQNLPPPWFAAVSLDLLPHCLSSPGVTPFCYRSQTSEQHLPGF
jgi:hypothetical protein